MYVRKIKTNTVSKWIRTYTDMYVYIFINVHMFLILSAMLPLLFWDLLDVWSSIHVCNIFFILENRYIHTYIPLCKHYCCYCIKTYIHTYLFTMTLKFKCQYVHIFSTTNNFFCFFFACNFKVKITTYIYMYIHTSVHNITIMATTSNSVFSIIKKKWKNKKKN